MRSVVAAPPDATPLFMLCDAAGNLPAAFACVALICAVEGTGPASHRFNPRTAVAADALGYVGVISGGNGGPPDGQPQPASKGKRKADSAFDLWLQRGLHKIFDDVANEPVPDELRRLIDGDREP